MQPWKSALIVALSCNKTASGNQAFNDWIQKHYPEGIELQNRKR